MYSQSAPSGGNEKQVKNGIRCRVCTGCGLCPGVQVAEQKNSPIHVLTQEVSPGIKCGQWVVAIDLGTTTIAMLLYNARGRIVDRFVCVNPQTKYGADVISRIQAAYSEHILKDLEQLVMLELEKGMKRFRKKTPKDTPIIGVIAANTTMIYLCMGWSPAELGVAPFCVSRPQAAEKVVAGVPCFVIPGLSAFVGGDITAGIFATGMWKEDKIRLLIDLGTNGEIVLGNREKMLATATAAGPAFEGGVNKGIWGADMVHLLAKLLKEGLVDETGLLCQDYFETGVRIGNVCVTQESIRGIQLAKAAIRSGIEILMNRYGIREEEIDEVILAGGFGYFLDPEDAACIGLLPRNLASKAFTGGNTALTGAALIAGELGDDGKVENTLRMIKNQTMCIVLSEEKNFGKRFIEDLNLKG